MKALIEVIQRQRPEHRATPMQITTIFVPQLNKTASTTVQKPRTHIDTGTLTSDLSQPRTY